MTTPTPISPTTTTLLLRDLALAASAGSPWFQFAGLYELLDREYADFQHPSKTKNEVSFICGCSPAAILALLSRLERAEAVVEAARKCAPAEHTIHSGHVTALFPLIRAYDTAAKAKGAGE